MKKRIGALILCCIMLLSVCFACKKTEENPSGGAARVKIAELCTNGVANYDIIIPQNASEAVVNAATHIQEYTQKATGASLQILQDGENSSKPYISIGNTALLQTENFTVDYQSFGKDGFYLKTVEKNYYISAKEDRGVLYGAYEFLESVVGIRFLTYDYTYIPDKPTVELYQTDRVEIPAITNRCYLSNQIMKNPQFASHMRMNNEYVKISDAYGGSMYGYKSDVLIGHNTLDYLSTDYYEEHPDWYYADENKIYDIHYSNLGLNEDGSINNALEISPIRVILERLKKDIQASGGDFFMIGQEDYTHTCKCDECLRQEKMFGRGGMLVRFMNALIREIESWQKETGIEKEIKFSTFAYYYSQGAPIDKEGNPLHPSVVPHEDLYIRLATIKANNYYGMSAEKQIPETRNMLAGWKKLTNQFLIWSYHTAYSGYMAYYPTMQHWEEDLRSYAECDMEYVLMQASYEIKAAWKDNMEVYVASKMMWNPNQSVEALKQEFIQYYYSVAADEVNEFINLFDTHYAFIMEGGVINPELIPVMTIWSAPDLMNSKLYTVSFWDRAFGILEDAQKKVEDSALSEEEKEFLIKKLRWIEMTPRYMVMMNFDLYYPNASKIEKKEFQGQFFDMCAEFDIPVYAENSSIDGLKYSIGYTG